MLCMIASSTTLLSSERSRHIPESNFSAKQALSYYFEQKGYGGDLATVLRMKLDRMDRKEKAYADRESAAEPEAKSDIPQPRSSVNNESGSLSNNAPRRTSKL